MQPFHHVRVKTLEEAVQLAGSAAARGQSVKFLAGGTSLVDLMKLDVVNPLLVIDLGAVRQADKTPVEASRRTLRLSAFATMSEVARHPLIRADYPLIAQSLDLAASQQIRNMATLGGNLLQETRCPYYRDTTWAACNRRNPGSGCAALAGANRQHAVLGGNDTCVATYPGDFAQALIALDATLTIQGPAGRRSLPIGQLHASDPIPGAASLGSAEVISEIQIPTGPHTKRSLYLKIRDRQSFAFALASAAVALVMRRGYVREARIALGGVATVPWRATEVEEFLRGKRLDTATAGEAGKLAFALTRPLSHNQYKIPLGAETLARALLEAKAMEV